MIKKEKIKEIKNSAISQIQNEEFKTAVLDFFDTLVENFEEEDLNTLFNNIKNLKIEKNETKNGYSLGEYHMTKEGHYITLSNPKTIYHELFHLASSYINNEEKKDYSGFSIKSHYDVNKSMGTGINEAYTEFLTQRYFSEFHDIHHGYDYIISIAIHLEKVVGKDYMEKCYLNADLSGVINELKKITSEKSILNFIKNVDYLNGQLQIAYAMEDEKTRNSLIENMKKIRTEIFDFLFQSYFNIINTKVESGEITEEEGIEIFKEYIYLTEEMKSFTKVIYNEVYKDLQNRKK